MSSASITILRGLYYKQAFAFHDSEIKSKYTPFILPLFKVEISFSRNDEWQMMLLLHVG